MSKRKFRDLTAIFFIGLFLLTFEPVFLWLLVGGLVLLQPVSDGTREENTNSSLLFEIGSDARKYGFNRPRSSTTRRLLIQVYQCYRRSLEIYPHLKQEYSEVIEEMWISLASESDQHAREKIIRLVLEEWPESSRSGDQSIQSKLRNVKELTAQWDEAKHEVQGGVHV